MNSPGTASKSAPESNPRISAGLSAEHRQRWRGQIRDINWIVVTLSDLSKDDTDSVLTSDS